MLKDRTDLDYQVKREEIMKERLFLRDGYVKAKMLLGEEGDWEEAARPSAISRQSAGRGTVCSAMLVNKGGRE